MVAVKLTLNIQRCLHLLAVDCDWFVVEGGTTDFYKSAPPVVLLDGSVA